MPDPMYQTPSPQALAPGSQEYQDKSMDLYRSSTEPSRRKALSRLEGDFAARGLGSSGLYGEARMGMEQDYLQGMEDFAGKSALEQADRQQNRGWQVEDRDTAWDRALKMMEHQEGRADAQRNQQYNQQMLSELFGAGGTVLGAMAGGPVGAGVGRSVGKAAASSIPGMPPSYESVY